MEYHTISENEAWRVDLIQELIAVRENEGEITGFTSEELDDIQKRGLSLTQGSDNATELQTNCQ